MTATLGGRAPVTPPSPANVIPSDPTELEEMLQDSKRMQAVYSDPDQFALFIENYARKTLDKDKEMVAQIREQTQLVLADFLREQREAGAQIPLDFGVKDVQRPGLSKASAIYNKRAPGVQLDSLFRDKAEYFQSIWHHADSLQDGTQIRNKLGNMRKIQNSFGSTVPGDGGFLIPENLRSELLAVALETAVVRSRATTIPMDSLRVPIPSVDDTSHASSVFGGIVAYWTEEGATLTESQASFGRVVLEAKKLTAYCETPNELVADAPAFGAFLDRTLPQAIAYYEDAAFMNGSGVGEPLGFYNSAAVISVGSRATPISWANVTNMYARMLPASLSQAVWIISPDVLPVLLQMTIASGAPVAIWLPNSQGIEAPVLSLLGRPVIVSEKTAAGNGTKGDIAFVDLGYYLIGDRAMMQATSSPHFKFSSDKTAYRVIERVDGRPWLNSAITPKNGSSTLSPVVLLA